MSRAKLLARARELGYDGPKSRTTQRLAEIVDELEGLQQEVEGLQAGDEPEPVEFKPQPGRIITPTLVKDRIWNGISKGDPVRVRGWRGVWLFHERVHNTTNGDEYVTVYGEIRTNLRCVTPDRITKGRRRT